MDGIFTAGDLKYVRLLDMLEAAHNLEIAQYGNKADIAARIVSSKGGKLILKKLVSTSLKKYEEYCRKVTFMKKERARLVTSGATDKKAIAKELKRLWMHDVARQHWKLVQQAWKAAPWVKHWIH